MFVGRTAATWPPVTRAYQPKRTCYGSFADLSLTEGLEVSKRLRATSSRYKTMNHVWRSISNFNCLTVRDIALHIIYDFLVILINY